MKVNTIGIKSNLRTKVPTILSKSKMKDAIEGMIHVDRGNLITKTNWMYDDTADYFLVLIKYLVTKAEKLLNRL